MDDDRLARRALRILQALSDGQPARMRPAGPSTCTLTGTDGRARRFPLELVDKMMARGWLTDCAGGHESDRRIAATKDGLTWRRRMLAGGDFAGQHRSMRKVTIDGTERALANLAESPLARLATPRGKGRTAWLDARQLAAGERLRADFEYGQLGQKVTASWDRARTVRDRKGGQCASDPSDQALDARARFNAALEAVGPELSGLLVDVCCFLKGLEEVEAARGWPRRSAKVVLRTALSALDRHYNPPPKARTGRMRHWGGQGYRPAMTT